MDRPAFPSDDIPTISRDDTAMIPGGADVATSDSAPAQRIADVGDPVILADDAAQTQPVLLL